MRISILAGAVCYLLAVGACGGDGSGGDEAPRADGSELQKQLLDDLQSNLPDNETEAVCPSSAELQEGTRVRCTLTVDGRNYRVAAEVADVTDKAYRWRWDIPSEVLADAEASNLPPPGDPSWQGLECGAVNDAIESGVDRFVDTAAKAIARDPTVGINLREVPFPQIVSAARESLVQLCEGSRSRAYQPYLEAGTCTVAAHAGRAGYGSSCPL